MTEVSRDLPDLLDYTGHGLITAGEHDGERWVADRGRAGLAWWRSDGKHCMSGRVLRRRAEIACGRLAAVLPEGAPEPPLGSVVRLVSAESQGAPQTRTPDGWCWIEGFRAYGHVSSWAQVRGFAEHMRMTVELLAVSVPGVAKSTSPELGASGDVASELGSPEGTEPAGSLHSSARNEDRPAVEARQLTENGDWEAVAQWCGGRVLGQTSDTVLMLNTYDDLHAEASTGDWIVRDGHEWFVVPGRHADAIAAAREASR